LFIKSLGSGYRYGSGQCEPDGCIFTQPVIFTIDDILFHLLFPMILLTAVASLFLILRPRSEKSVIEGASILFSGSFLFIFSMLGGIAPLGIIGIMATMFLVWKTKKYLNIYYAIIIMLLYPILFW
jgi:predicted membrane protein